VGEPHPTDPLISAYGLRLRGAYGRILEYLARAIRDGRGVPHYRLWARTIEAELVALQQYTQEWATGTEGAASSAWLQGARASGEALGAQGVAVDAVRWYVLPRDAILAVERELLRGIGGALSMAQGHASSWMQAAVALADAGGAGPYDPLPLEIGRRINDEFRRAGLEAVQRKLTEGMTIRQTRDALLQELTQSGLTSFVDQAGRRWNLVHYADMVARTTSREAYTAGTIAVVQRSGHDLVRATEHYPTCDMCASRQGRVYSLSGTHPDFPALSESGVHFPWHNSCGHVLTPVVESYLTPEELERLKALSNLSFDTDPRSAREKRAYDRSQTLNRLRLEKQRLLEERANGIPADANMIKWDAERRAPETTPERKKDLARMIGDAADRQEQHNRDRVKTINDEIIRLNRLTNAEIKTRGSAQ
jgi:hypothetical protein